MPCFDPLQVGASRWFGSAVRREKKNYLLIDHCCGSCHDLIPLIGGRKLTQVTLIGRIPVIAENNAGKMQGGGSA